MLFESAGENSQEYGYAVHRIHHCCLCPPWLDCSTAYLHLWRSEVEEQAVCVGMRIFCNWEADLIFLYVITDQCSAEPMMILFNVICTLHCGACIIYKILLILCLRVDLRIF